MLLELALNLSQTATELPMMRLFSNRFSSLGRRFLGVLLALSVAWLSGGNAAIAARTPPAPSFSDSQIAQIRKARSQMTMAQSRLEELGDYINAQDWTYTSNFIHGPLGDLRRQAATINRNLVPAKEQKEAYKQAKALMAVVERIDAAAKDKNASQASKNFVQLEDSLDEYLSLVPNFEPELAPEPTPAPAKAVSSSLEKLVDTVEEVTEAAAEELEEAVEAVQEGVEAVEAAIDAD